MVNANIMRKVKKKLAIRTFWVSDITGKGSKSKTREAATAGRDCTQGKVNFEKQQPEERAGFAASHCTLKQHSRGQSNIEKKTIDVGQTEKEAQLSSIAEQPDTTNRKRMFDGLQVQFNQKNMRNMSGKRTKKTRRE